jgi:hypothetical protein
MIGILKNAACVGNATHNGTQCVRERERERLLGNRNRFMNIINNEKSEKRSDKQEEIMFMFGEKRRCGWDGRKAVINMKENSQSVNHKSLFALCVRFCF